MRVARLPLRALEAGLVLFVRKSGAVGMSGSGVAASAVTTMILQVWGLLQRFCVDGTDLELQPPHYSLLFVGVGVGVCVCC